MTPALALNYHDDHKTSYLRVLVLSQFTQELRANRKKVAGARAGKEGGLI